MINKDKIKEQIGCDDKFLAELLDTFVRESQITNNLMKNALIENDLAKVGGYAHKMLSSMRIFDLNELSKYLEKIELYASSEENTEQIPDLVKKFNSSLEQTIDEIVESELKPG